MKAFALKREGVLPQMSRRFIHSKNVFPNFGQKLLSLLPLRRNTLALSFQV